MISVTVQCPRCDEDITIECEYQEPEYDVGIWGGYIAYVPVLGERDGCHCYLTQKEIDELERKAEEKANEWRPD